MKAELNIQLAEKYPILFKNKNLSPKETLMCFGCECGDGWYRILDCLFGYLTSLMKTKIHVNYNKEYQDKYRDQPDFYVKYSSYIITTPQIILDQVKEKFGTLRVYYHYSDNKIAPDDIADLLDKTDLDKKLTNFYAAVDNAIDFAEYQSGVTCEETGKPGKLYTQGWHRVLCDEKANENGYDVEEGATGFMKEIF
jgi:hypothetical protein